MRGSCGMRSTSKVVLVVHPDSQMRILLRSILQDESRTVLTDHSCSDLLSDQLGDVPAVILMDRSFLNQQGVDVLSLFHRKWNDTEVVLLPEGLEIASTQRDTLIQLLRHVDRLLSMKSTKELLAVPKGTG
jgi:FixJ family two-component response regulator